MDKATILALISDSLDSGKLTLGDLRSIIDSHTDKTSTEEVASASNTRLSAVDVIFYIAGIVLFASIAALASQAWDNGAGVRIFISAGVGTILWALALTLMRSPDASDIRRGMTNAMLLAGSLSIIAGGFITANEFVYYDDFNFYASAATLALLGVLHVGFGWQIKRDFITLIGVLLAVAAFPCLVFGLLSGSDAPLFINALVAAIGGGLLVYATRVVSWIGASSPAAERAFDSLGAFIVLMSLYAASFDEGTGLIWLLVLIAGIIGLFYLSIVMQNKLMLGNGSLFLVMAIITVSFRYFSGYGAATSLLIGALGLFGTAIIATTINRRYISSS